MTRLLTVQQAADLCACHPQTLRRAIKAGELTSRRIGRGVRVPEDELAAWVARMSADGETQEVDAEQAPPQRSAAPQRRGRRVLSRGVG